MPITTQDRFFGEGISSYGVEDAASALKSHRHHFRQQRLKDLLGPDAKQDNADIALKFDKIKLAVEAADQQVERDNAAFIRKHKLNEAPNV